MTDLPEETGDERADAALGGSPSSRLSVWRRSAARSTAPSCVLEMDCDFFHDPDDVPRLIAAAAGADLVLGSRYVDGGRGQRI